MPSISKCLLCPCSYCAQSVCIHGFFSSSQVETHSLLHGFTTNDVIFINTNVRPSLYLALNMPFKKFNYTQVVPLLWQPLVLICLSLPQGSSSSLLKCWQTVVRHTLCDNANANPNQQFYMCSQISVFHITHAQRSPYALSQSCNPTIPSNW